jgi:hypothetical protein
MPIIVFFGMFMRIRCCSAEAVLEATDPVFAWRENFLASATVWRERPLE